MENPQLTFYGEKYLDSEHLTRTIPHEIAHSWFGNTVTHKNYEHFWLKEGLTTFMTSNIIAKLYGTSEQGLWETLQWDNLKRNIEHFKYLGRPWTALVNNFTGEEIFNLRLHLYSFPHFQA